MAQPRVLTTNVINNTVGIAISGFTSTTEATRRTLSDQGRHLLAYHCNVEPAERIDVRMNLMAMDRSRLLREPALTATFALEPMTLVCSKVAMLAAVSP